MDEEVIDRINIDVYLSLELLDWRKRRKELAMNHVCVYNHP